MGRPSDVPAWLRAHDGWQDRTIPRHTQEQAIGSLKGVFMISQAIRLDADQLRQAIQDEYTEVARNPDQGFHFHTGRRLAARCGSP
jgi:hypothetical protein